MSAAEMFAEMRAKREARMALLRDVMARDGVIVAESVRDPGYCLMLTPSAYPGVAWQVTSFRDGEAMGHREYDVLEGRSPIADAFQEFASESMRIVEG